MTTRTITVTAKGRDKSVETPYTDEQALAVLTALVTTAPLAGSSNRSAHKLARSEFACSLAAKGAKWGLSPKQAAWVHVLVVEAEAPQKAQPSTGLALESVRSLLDTAASSGLKAPSVTIDANGAALRFNRAGGGARNPGVIYITNGAAWGSDDRKFYGSIDHDGGWRPAADATPAICAAIEAFDADPEGQATAYGKRTGRCCFCSRELTDGRSVYAGYGETCAGNYGLPWGEEEGGDQEPTPFDIDPERALVRRDEAGEPGDTPTGADDFVWKP